MAFLVFIKMQQKFSQSTCFTYILCSVITVRYIVESFKKDRTKKVKIAVQKYWKLQWKIVKTAIEKLHLIKVHWSTTSIQWLQKMQWKCSGNRNTVETCTFCSQKICSVDGWPPLVIFRVPGSNPGMEFSKNCSYS